jgi:hypothetical protein
VDSHSSRVVHLDIQSSASTKTAISIFLVSITTTALSVVAGILHRGGAGRLGLKETRCGCSHELAHVRDCAPWFSAH